MMISSENAGKVSKEHKFHCAVYWKDEGNDSILCQFWRCCMHKNEFRGLLLLLVSRGLPLGARGRLYYACICSMMLYGSDTWPVKDEDVIDYTEMMQG